MQLPRIGLSALPFTLIYCNLTRAQDFPASVHQQTTTPPNARYEIVQSELATKLTFRLDRFTVYVRQLVRTKEDNNAWEVTRVIDLPLVTSPSRPRFQTFTSGLAGRHAFLIDTETGKTWVVVNIKGKNPDGTEHEEVVWEPFEE